MLGVGMLAPIYEFCKTDPKAFLSEINVGLQRTKYIKMCASKLLNLQYQEKIHFVNNI